MATVTAPKTESLSEFFAGVGGALDKENHVIRGVKLLGLESKNGRSYLPVAVKAALRLYEGAKVNVNHPKGRPDQPRDYQDRLGNTRNVEYREGLGLYGDLHYNPAHPVAAQLEHDAAHSPDSVGLSHNVEARTSKRDGKTVVESIVRVQSVDLVADPATTGGLFEHEEPEMSIAEMTVEAILAARPDLTDAVLTEAKQSSEAKDAATKLALLEAENKALKAEKAAQDRKAAVDAKLVESKLPETVLTESIKTVAYGMDDAGLTAFIESLQVISKGLPVRSSGKAKSDEQDAGRFTESQDAAPINPKAVASKYRG